LQAGVSFLPTVGSFGAARCFADQGYFLVVQAHFHFTPDGFLSNRARSPARLTFSFTLGAVSCKPVRFPYKPACFLHAGRGSFKRFSLFCAFPLNNQSPQNRAAKPEIYSLMNLLNNCPTD